MSRPRRYTSLADRAATANVRDPLVGGTGVDNRGVLEVVWSPTWREQYTATRRVAQHGARNSPDCWLLLAALGLVDDDGRELT